MDILSYFPTRKGEEEVGLAEEEAQEGLSPWRESRTQARSESVTPKIYSKHNYSHIYSTPTVAATSWLRLLKGAIRCRAELVLCGFQELQLAETAAMITITESFCALLHGL